jgi:hypothetical protein
MGWADRVAAEVPQLKRGRVWCTKCGRSERVNASESLATGWPTCCGYTMTIDSPEERTALADRSRR